MTHDLKKKAKTKHPRFATFYAWRKQLTKVIMNCYCTVFGKDIMEKRNQSIDKLPKLWKVSTGRKDIK